MFANFTQDKHLNCNNKNPKMESNPEKKRNISLCYMLSALCVCLYVSGWLVYS